MENGSKVVQRFGVKVQSLRDNGCKGLWHEDSLKTVLKGKGWRVETVLAAKRLTSFVQRLGTKVQRLCFGMKGAKAFGMKTVETLFKLHLGWRVQRVWDGKRLTNFVKRLGRKVQSLCFGCRKIC